MAIGETFVVGEGVRVHYTPTHIVDYILRRIDTGKAAYPFDDRTLLRLTRFQDGDWYTTWHSAEDPDVHPLPNIDEMLVPWVAHCLIHGPVPIPEFRNA